MGVGIKPWRTAQPTADSIVVVAAMGRWVQTWLGAWPSVGGCEGPLARTWMMGHERCATTAITHTHTHTQPGAAPINQCEVSREICCFHPLFTLVCTVALCTQMPPHPRLPEREPQPCMIAPLRMHRCRSAMCSATSASHQAMS